MKKTPLKTIKFGTTLTEVVAHRMTNPTGKGFLAKASNVDALAYLRNRILFVTGGAVPFEEELAQIMEVQTPGWKPTDLFPEYAEVEPERYATLEDFNNDAARNLPPEFKKARVILV